MMNECPAEVVIFGIQPEIMAPGEDLSEALQNNFESYVYAVEAVAQDQLPSHGWAVSAPQ